MNKPKIVSGKKAWFVHKRLLALIFLELLQTVKSPVRALQEVRRLRKLRSKVHGNQRISKFVKSDNLYYWVTDFPGLPSDNLKHTLQLEYYRQQQFEGKDTKKQLAQQTLIWGITNRCPLQCTHCYDWDNIDCKDHLSLDQLKAILQKIKEHGIRHIQLSGGEPLARYDDMLSILREESKSIDFWLLTSGFGLTAEKAQALKQAGLKGANISLDHWAEEYHNRFRNNPKSYDWVMKAVQNCSNAGIMVSLSLCATKEFVTRDNLEKYAALSKKIGAHFIRILEPRKAGKFADKPVSLSKDQIDLLSEFTIRMNTEKEFREHPVVVFFGYHQRALGCMGAGNRYFYIDANGDFHACPFCRGRRGNGLSDNFDEVILRLREAGCQAFKTIPVVEKKHQEEVIP